MFVLTFDKRVLLFYSPPKSKNKKELMKYILKADKRKSTTPVEPIKPPPYSENPAYEV